MSGSLSVKEDVRRLLAGIRECYHAGDFEEALALIEQASSLAPRQATIHYNKAMVLFKMKRLDEAEEACRAVLQLNPTHSHAKQLLDRIETETRLQPEAADESDIVDAEILDEQETYEECVSESKAIGVSGRADSPFSDDAVGASLRRSVVAQPPPVVSAVAASVAEEEHGAGRDTANDSDKARQDLYELLETLNSSVESAMTGLGCIGVLSAVIGALVGGVIVGSLIHPVLGWIAAPILGAFAIYGCSRMAKAFDWVGMSVDEHARQRALAMAAQAGLSQDDLSSLVQQRFTNLQRVWQPAEDGASPDAGLGRQRFEPTECDGCRPEVPKLADTASSLKGDWMLGQGVAKYERGEYEAAMACFERGLESDPSSSQLWYHRGRALEKLGRYDEAIASYDGGLQITPQDADLWKGKALSLTALGRDEEVIMCCDRGLQGKPSDSGLWGLRGQALAAQGRYEEAAASCERCLQIAPGDSSVWWKIRGASLHELGRHEEALWCFDQGIEIDPNDGGFWANKGLSLHALRRSGEAVPCFDRALQMMPGDTRLWKAKGLALGAMGQCEAAIACFDRADPDDGGVWKSKGVALGTLGRHHEAIACFDRGLHLAPRDGALWHCKGVALKAIGKAQEAEPCFAQTRWLEE